MGELRKIDRGCTSTDSCSAVLDSNWLHASQCCVVRVYTRRITAGEWLGPWTLCHTLQEVVNRAHPVGLHVHLANTPGGGAPVLYTDRFARSVCRHQQSIAIL